MIIETRVDKIQVKDGTGYHDLYDRVTGRKTEYQVPTGTTWELRVLTYAKNDAAGWAESVTVVANGVPDAYVKQGKTARNTTSGGHVRAFDFNMGSKLETRVLPRVKFWTSEFYTTSLPPENEW